jgi:hypothetical protein
MPGNGNSEFIKMPEFRLIIAFLFTAYCLNGQQNAVPELKSRYKPGLMWNFTGFRPAKAGKAKKYDRLVFDVTYNDWFGDLRTFRNKWSSIGLNTNLLFDISLNRTSTISLGTGFRHSLFRTENLAHLFAADPTRTYTTVTDGSQASDVKRRLLCGNAIGFPVEFRFRTKAWQHFKFHVGGTLAYQLNIYAKSVFSGQEGREVVKDFNFADVNRLSLSTHVRMGIRNWGVYASYGVTPMFSNRSSTNLHIFQLAVSVSLF